MDIASFMRGYKQAWEERDEPLFCAASFADDGAYRHTPLPVQRGRTELAADWQRVKLQQDVRPDCELLGAAPGRGVAHWQVEYQVASEALFRIWAASAGTHQLERKPGEPLPRMVLDGVLSAEFDGEDCRGCRLWWHSMPKAA